MDVIKDGKVLGSTEGVLVNNPNLVPGKVRNALSFCCVAAVYTYKYNINTILSRAIQQRYSQFEGLGKKGRITWLHGGTHLQNEAGAFHAPSVEPDPDPLHSSPPYF